MEAGFRPNARRPVIALVAVLLAGMLTLAVAQAAQARPQLLAPGNGKVLARGSTPTFKLRDTHPYARRYSIFMIVSPGKRTNRYGELKRNADIGTFARMNRKGKYGFTYKTPSYSFDRWFMNRPGKYYWQAFHIDCRVRGCHVLSKIRSFRVR